jgi:Right handed beta helix region
MSTKTMIFVFLALSCFGLASSFTCVTVGYSPNASYKVPSPTSDALFYMKSAISTFKNNGGGCLMIEEGVYKMSSYIEFPGNTTVVGAGMDKTILRLKDYATPWWIAGTGNKRSGFIRAIDVSNLVFANFTIDGNRENQNTDKYSEYGRYGFYTEACVNVTVDGMAVRNFQGYGFDPHGDKQSMTWSNYLTIMNSRSENNGWDGYTIDQTYNALLRNNTSIGNGRHGFNIVTGSRYITMVDNTATNNGFWYYKNTSGCGIMIQNNYEFGTGNVSISNSVITNSTDAGMCITEVFNIIALNNSITKTANNVCMRLRNVTNGVVAYTTCTGASRGITVTTSTNVSVTNTTKLARKLLM